MELLHGSSTGSPASDVWMFSLVTAHLVGLCPALHPHWVLVPRPRLLLLPSTPTHTCSEPNSLAHQVFISWSSSHSISAALGGSAPLCWLVFQKTLCGSEALVLCGTPEQGQLPAGVPLSAHQPVHSEHHFASCSL